MADRKPLVLVDGILSQIPDDDILECQTYASMVVGLQDAAKDAIGLDCVADSSTISWTYDDTAKQLKASVINFSLTNEQIADDAAIAWSKIDKTGSTLADLTTRNHNDLQNIQGGSVASYFHLTQAEHDTLTLQQDASNLHNHASLYYSKTELATPGSATVDWTNIANTPATYPPSPHTHTASDITDLTEAVQDIVGAFLTDTDTISWYYDDSGNLLYGSVKYTDSTTISISENTSGLIASVIANSLTDNHIAANAAIAWSKINKAGSKLSDISNVVIDTIETGQGIIFDGTNFVPADLVTDSSLQAHRTAVPIDHPDQSVTKAKLALDIDASDIGFNADKVDGADLNDSGTATNTIWSAAKIISFVNAKVESKTTWLNPVLDKDLCTPPTTPNDGDRYIVCANSPAGTATGAWAGYENYIAQYDASTTSWQLESPLENDVVYVEDEDKVYGYNGTEWVVRFAAINDHEHLNDLLGGAPNEHYHITSLQHQLLTTQTDASSLHNHASLYYTKTELVTPNTGPLVDWTNIANTPATYPPSPHTHTSSDITDFDDAVKNVVDEFIIDSSTVNWTYDSTNDTLEAYIPNNSITWDQLAFSSIPWANVDKTGSKLSDLANVSTPTATSGKQILVYDPVSATWNPQIHPPITERIPFKCLSSGPTLDPTLHYPIHILLDGFFYKNDYVTQNQRSVQEFYTITSPLTFNTVDQGALLDSNWYSMFVVLDPTTNTLDSCLSLIQRVNQVNYSATANTTTIVLGSQSTPSTILTTSQLGWSTDIYSTNPGQVLVLTGTYEGQLFTITSNTTQGQAAIVVEGDLSSLSQGDWLLLSPQGYGNNFKYIGDGYVIDASTPQWRSSYCTDNNKIYYTSPITVFSGSTYGNVNQVELTAFAPPTALELLECEASGSGLSLHTYLDSNGNQETKYIALQGYFIFYNRQQIGGIPINTKEHSIYVNTNSYITLYIRGYTYGSN